MSVDTTWVRSKKMVRNAMGKGVLAAVVALLALLGSSTTAHAAFEVVNFTADAYSDGMGTLETRAGARPFMAETLLEFTEIAHSSGGFVPDGSVRDVIVDVPVGFVGNPNNVPKCAQRDIMFYEPGVGGLPSCSPGSRIGVAHIKMAGPFTLWLPWPLFNMEPPPNVPAQFAFYVMGVPVYLNASVRPDDHGLRITSERLSGSLPVAGTRIELWGVPASSAHDVARGGPSGAAPKAFLSNPGDCSQLPVTKVRTRSWQDPDSWSEAEYVGSPITGCEALEFNPQIEVAPTSSRADVPSGYRIEVTTTQNEDAASRATANLKKAVVTLPEGIAVNPSAANGLGACSEAQIGLGTDDPIACPDSSKIGQVTIDTPLLEKQMSGPVYLAEQDKNPFGSTLAIYLAPKGAGVQLKLAGEVTPDPVTGQLTTTFDDNPPLPFNSLVMELKGGPRAALVNPSTCGTKTVKASFTSWAMPDEVVERSSSFVIDASIDGGPCPATPSDHGFVPTLRAGTMTPTAGEYSPFSFAVARHDGDQELKTIERVRLPEGLLGNVGSVPICGAAAADLGACSESSRVGRVEAALGAGTEPLWVPAAGKSPTAVYLAGPYRGAPYSLSIVVPAQAGPFDLGKVVVRTALHVNERTAAITTGVEETRLVGSDGTVTEVLPEALPRILEGIVLRQREIRVIVDRDGFMVNPTDCSPKQITAEVRSFAGGRVDVGNRFRAADCARLGFAPRFAARILNKGRKSTLRSFHPRTRFAVVPRRGDANIGGARVVLPSSTLLDQGNIGTTCTRAQMAARACPDASIVGYAKAWSPLLRKPVEGPVFLAANGGVRPLPDLAAVLDGEIRVVLQGEIATRRSGGKARLQNTFRVVPDAPVDRFVLTMRGGAKRGLLVNSTDLCRTRERGSVVFFGQNGRRHTLRPRIATSFKGCAKVRRQVARKVAKRKAARRSAARRVG